MIRQAKRLWSFKSLTSGTVFRLVLICWICSWFAVFIPLVLIAPIRGVENVSLYIQTLKEHFWFSAQLGAWAAILFFIFLVIFYIRLPEDTTLYVRHLWTIVGGGLGLILPTSILYATWFWGNWERYSSGVGIPALEQGLGFMLVGFVVFVQPLGLILGSIFGYSFGLKLERRKKS
jgi:hypothetical protein